MWISAPRVILALPLAFALHACGDDEGSTDGSSSGSATAGTADDGGTADGGDATADGGSTADDGGTAGDDGGDGDGASTGGGETTADDGSGTSGTGTGETGTGDGGTTGAQSCDGITPQVTDLTPEQLHTMLQQKDFKLINVHIPYQGEIPDTDVHIDYTDTSALEAELGHDDAAKAVLYCRTGPMSVYATENLVALGYCQIYDLPGGMVGWEQAGYPIEGG